MIPKIYAYQKPHIYLQEALAVKRRQNPLFSMRAWAQQMGFRNHTSLLFLLKGQRPIRPEHIEKINRGLRLEGNEEKYFRLLVQLQHVTSPQDRMDCEDQMRLLMPDGEQSLLEVDQFKSIADWIHMALLEMTELEDFNSSPAWIVSRLKFPISEVQVSEALNRLLQLGLLERQGDSLVKTQARLTTPKDRASESIREHHRQVLNNALHAIDQQGIHERVFNSCTFTVDSAKLEEAKNLILKFRSDMSKLMEKKQGDETYQLAVQFFKLTEKPSPTYQ